MSDRVSFVQVDLNESPGSPSYYDADYNSVVPPSLNGALIITHYAYEWYEGSGTAAIRYASGKWDVRELGHCSCNGPWEESPSNWPTDGQYTTEQVLKLLASWGGKGDAAVAAAVAAFSGDRAKLKPFLHHKDSDVRLAALRAIGATANVEG